MTAVRFLEGFERGVPAISVKHFKCWGPSFSPPQPLVTSLDGKRWLEIYHIAGNFRGGRRNIFVVESLSTNILTMNK